MVYDLQVKIPEVLVLIDGDFRYWYYTDKVLFSNDINHQGQILTRDENLLKPKTIFDYFQNPSIIEESDRATSRESQDQKLNPYKPLFNISINVQEGVSVHFATSNKNIAI